MPMSGIQSRPATVQTVCCVMITRIYTVYCGGNETRETVEMRTFLTGAYDEDGGSMIVRNNDILPYH
jgi:hypothetical protein